MAYAVTRLVRQARLPATIRHRAITKAILLVLADRCNRDGRDAWPSLDTICGETEIKSRITARGHLQSLCDHGLIHEQQPPSQHRPRVWQLDLDAIRRLIPEGQAAIRLNPADSEGQLDDPDGQLSSPEGQFTAPDGQRLIPDPVLMNGPLNGPLNFRTLAPTPSFTHTAKEPNGGNFFVIRKIAIEVLEDADGALTGFDFVERVKQKCADLQIDYGRADGVSVAVVQRACDSAVGWRKLQSIKPKVTSPGKGAV